jgi:ADP-heptose:LPS heptosyltransferase
MNSRSDAGGIEGGNELWLVRKGHMGDVILTEPVARALRTRYHRIVLVTKYVAIGRLLQAYDEVRDYAEFAHAPASAVDLLTLTYEHRRDLHYLDAYAEMAHVTLADRLPRLAGGDRQLSASPYCLLAPHTSEWRRTMRTWPQRFFFELGRAIVHRFNLRVITLDDSTSFEDMLGLIRHCTLFVGNDSGPAIIAQCYGRAAVVLFGGTRPASVLFGATAVGLSHDVGCNGCLHDGGADSDSSCATPLCLRALTVSTVIDAVARQLSSLTKAALVSRGK